MEKYAHSLPEAAEMAGTSLSVLRRQIADSNLTVKYIGTKPVVLADELKAWLQSLPDQPTK
jgi:hypothetical protein